MPDKSQTETQTAATERGEWTPEPWQVVPIEWQQLPHDYQIVNEQEWEVVSVYASCNPNAKEDAARIIACVNACAGISSEDLARGVVPMDEAMAAINAVGAMVNEKSEAV